MKIPSLRSDSELIAFPFLALSLILPLSFRARINDKKSLLGALSTVRKLPESVLIHLALHKSHSMEENRGESVLSVV